MASPPHPRTPRRAREPAAAGSPAARGTATGPPARVHQAAPPAGPVRQQGPPDWGLQGRTKASGARQRYDGPEGSLGEQELAAGTGNTFDCHFFLKGRPCGSLGTAPSPWGCSAGGSLGGCALSPGLRPPLLSGLLQRQWSHLLLVWVGTRLLGQPLFRLVILTQVFTIPPSLHSQVPGPDGKSHGHPDARQSQPPPHTHTQHMSSTEPCYKVILLN